MRASATTSRWCGLADSSGLSTNGLGSARRARFRADPEQVRRGAVEVQAPAVDVHPLEQALPIPARELVAGEVRDLLAHARFDRARVLVEIQADAAHAFALVLQYARVERRGGRQRRGDRRFRAGEVAGIHLGDHCRYRGAGRHFCARRDPARARNRQVRRHGEAAACQCEQQQRHATERTMLPHRARLGSSSMDRTRKHPERSPT
jgi:hypothetical protein